MSSSSSSSSSFLTSKYSKLSDGETNLHKCQNCNIVSECGENACECYIFATYTFCDRTCKEDFVKKCRMVYMESKSVVPCDLHVLFDLETSGHSSEHDEVLELGAMVDIYWAKHSRIHHLTNLLQEKKSKAKLEYNVYIKNTKAISQKVIDIHGITKEMLRKKGVSKQVAIKGFFEWIQGLVSHRPATVYLTAYNCHGFDSRFLQKLASGSGVSPPDGIYFCFGDSMIACKDSFRGYKDSWKLTSVYQTICQSESSSSSSEKSPKAHTAMGDNYMQQEIILSAKSETRALFYESIVKHAKPVYLGADIPVKYIEKGIEKINVKKS